MDRAIFFAVSMLWLLLVFVVGDVLYFGVWYYVVVPVCGSLLALIFKPQRYFLIGVALAILLSYIPYFYYNLTAPHPDGMLGLGHLFSLPGLAVGIILAGWYLASRVKASLFICLVGFIVPALGFLLNQLVVCNTFLYCGDVLSGILPTT